MEGLFCHIKALVELYYLIKTLCGRVKPLDKKLLLPLLGKYELYKLYDSVIGDNLVFPKQREVL